MASAGLIQGLVTGGSLVVVTPSPASRDVIHHRLQALPNRANSRQSPAIDRCGVQGCRDACTVAAVAVVVLMDLGV